MHGLGYRGEKRRPRQVGNPNEEAWRKRVPGYPQDMVMFMDKEVAKPETYGLPPGWTGSFMGMMTMVRVLPLPQVLLRVSRGWPRCRRRAPRAPPRGRFVAHP